MEFYEKVDNGSYRRAGSIALGGSCISCHTSASFGPPSSKPKYAGLVISVPVMDEGGTSTTGERGASTSGERGASTSGERGASAP